MDYSNEELARIYAQYLGCQIRHSDGETAKLIEVGLDSLGFIHDGTGSYGKSHTFAGIQLILRSIDQLTDDEKVKWYDSYCDGSGRSASSKVQEVNEWLEEKTLLSPAEHFYLTSIGIDLYNLLQTSHAIKDI